MPAKTKIRKCLNTRIIAREFIKTDLVISPETHNSSLKLDSEKGMVPIRKTCGWFELSGGNGGPLPLSAGEPHQRR
jgi:hypothetical protein